MKKYYKFFIILIIASFIIPQVALASWWNPFSWSVWNIFKPQTATMTTSTATAKPNTQQNGQNNSTNISPITKNLNQQKPKIATQPVSSVSTDIEGKIQYVVQIVCPISGGTMSGTGIIMYGSSANDNQVITNKHVLNGATGPCSIYKTSDYETAPTLYYTSGSQFIFSTNHDLAIITPNAYTFTTPYSNTNVEFSQTTDLLDKNINVLGYPVSAGNNITLTNGIISGTENIENITMYKTDAKIDKGNSGGAVFDENGEFIGIPTLATQGSFSSYGYIIPASIIKDFLNAVEDGYAKQNWQNSALTLYGVSPSNTVPEPPSSVTQNPPPNSSVPPTQDATLKVAQCQANAQAVKDDFTSFGKSAMDASFSGTPVPPDTNPAPTPAGSGVNDRDFMGMLIKMYGHNVLLYTQELQLLNNYISNGSLTADEMSQLPASDQQLINDYVPTYGTTVVFEQIRIVKGEITQASAQAKEKDEALISSTAQSDYDKIYNGCLNQ